MPSDFDDVSDYDNDGLINAEEIDWESSLIKNKSLRTYDNLPTIDDCISHFSDKGELSYVQNGLTRLQALPGSVYSELMTIRILPINSDPLSVDGDGDGLFDGDYRRNDNNEIIAPIDEHPLKIDGPVGAWNKHIEEVGEKDDIPTKLEGYYECDGDTGNISEIDFGELDITDSKSVYDFLKKYTTGVWQPGASAAGSRFLMFRVDDKGKALHSQTMADRYDYLVNEIKNEYGEQIPQAIKDNILDNDFVKYMICQSDIQIDTWQRPFGYNDLYDQVFNYGTNGNMTKEQFFFSEDDDDYVLWIWRGDYLNCGPGAEMGIYKKAIDVDILGKDIEHWKVADFNLPMTLNLYDYQNGKYDTVFNWYPENPQWWITGFAPDKTYNGIENQIMIGSVDFSKYNEYDENGEVINKMYEAFEDYFTNEERDIHDYVIFDDNNKTVWICWYEKEVWM